MERLMICGSRDATPEMLAYTRAVVERALARGFFLIAGDAPGVDQAVAEAVRDLYQHEDEMMLGLRVYGLSVAPRHGIYHPRIAYKQLKSYVKETREQGYRDIHIYRQHIAIDTYAKRDEYALRESGAVMCLWNGSSKGTKRVFDLAGELGFPRWLAVPCEGGMRIVAGSGRV